MKRFTLILSLLAAGLLSIPAFSQQLQKTYDTGSDDYGNMSVFDNAGNIYTVGSSSYVGAGGYDALLMKADTAGVFQWHKQYGGSGTEFGTALVGVSDGIVIAGRSSSFTSGNLDILVVKTDFNGDILWAKTYGTDSAEYATHIATTIDNGFIVTGETKSFGNGGTEMFLLKTDSLGNVDWFKTYGSNSDERGYDVFQEVDSGYVLSGVSRGAGSAGMNDIYLVKTDVAGNIQVQLLIGTTGDDIPRRIVSNPGVSVTIAGNTRAPGGNDDLFVGKLNVNTVSFDWFNTYGGTGNDGTSDLVQVPGEGYAVSGFSQSFGSSVDGIIVRLDSIGNVDFSGVLQGNGDDFIQDVAVGNNGGLATAYTNSYGGTANDIYLIRIGNDPLCEFQPVTLTVAQVVPTVNIALILHSATTGSLTANPVTLTSSSATSTVNDVCSSLPLLAEAGTNQTTCPGGQVQIGGNPSANGGTPPYTYAWSPSTGLDSDTISNPIASPTGTAVYFLTVTDSTGATATDSVTVNIGAVSFGSISPPFPNICSGQNVTMTASGGTSYLWNTGATTAVIVEFPPNGATNYTVIVTNNGCNDTVSTIVTSHTRPTPILSQGDTTICTAASIIITASGAQTYLWSPSSTLSSDTASTVTATPTGTTTYSVTGKNGHCAGTPASVTITVTVCVGVAKISPAIASIFPNPASNVINISFEANSASEGIVSLTATDGRVVKESTINITAGENKFSMDTEKLASGLYYLRIKSEHFTSTESVVIK